MLILFEAGGLHLGREQVLDGEPASTSQKHALVLVGSPCGRVRSGSCVTSAVKSDSGELVRNQLLDSR
jgi:hypothetical protein